MDKDDKSKKALTKKPAGLKKRRLGMSRHRLVEVVPHEIADAEIAKDFEDSKLWPDEEKD